MKKNIFTLLFLMSLLSAYSAKWMAISSQEPSQASVTLVSSNIETSVIRFTLEGYLMNEITTPRGIAYTITVDEATPILEKGAPDLAKLTTSIIIPDQASMSIEIVSSQYKEFADIEVAPSKGNLTRDIDPASVPFVYGQTYQEDAFYPGVIAGMRDPYILRDYRGQAIIVYPFQYNPVTKTLRVYSDITVKVTSSGNSGKNPLIRRSELTNVDKDFNTLYKDHFLNGFTTRYTPVEEEGRMLIISYGDFIPYMQPFINWKIQIGRPVELVDVATIGGSSAIKTYVQNYYYTYGLTYLLLVGDAAQVPTSYSTGDSDNDYSYIVGDDHYPDLFVGRFSAESNDQVTIQVQRTIEYEKNPDMSFDWFTRSTGIGSDQGPGDDNEYDYQHIRNLQTKLLDYTYTYNAELFDGSQGGNDEPGYPTPAMVSEEVNTGNGIMLYCGHGSATSWGTTGFSNSDVDNLVNYHMYPFIWSVACVNGDFVGNTCFAEAWLRANQEGEPTGAIATLMSTINQSWSPPMEGEDEMVDILVESYSDNIKRTFGGLSMNGCMKMNDSYGIDGDQMTDTWNCFGDPSVIVRTAYPFSLSVEYQNPVPLGTTELTVTTNATEGLVSLTFQNQIIATAYINGGSATLTFNPLNSLEEFTLTVTSYNRTPYIGTLTVVGQPGQVMNPIPADGQGNIVPFTKLYWEDGLGGIPDQYTVYFGTDNPPTNIVNGNIVYNKLYSPPAELQYETQYYWRIDATNQYGTTMGQIWQFITAAPPDENFETGDFSSFDWTFGGDLPWIIDSENPFNGLYCAKSGLITDNQTSSLTVQLEIDAIFSVPISFYKMISSDIGDKLQFIIDGEIIDEWTGITSYSLESYLVTAGVHTFEWRYVKNASGSVGDDCAWIDYIYFPPLSNPQVNAGDDATICEGITYTLAGQAINYNLLEWTSSGDGTFDDPAILNTLYTPGQQDYETGSAVITLTVYTQIQSVSDDMVLHFNPLPDVPFTPVGPTYVDIYYTPSSEYTSEGALNATSYSWKLTPENAGNLLSDGSACIVNWNSGFLGIATLSVKGINDCGQGPYSDALEITVDNTVGFDENDMNINILPNPNSGLFKVDINSAKQEKISIQILDLLGNKVLEDNSAQINGNFSRIFDMRDNKKGLYILFIDGESFRVIKKVIIQ